MILKVFVRRIDSVSVVGMKVLSVCSLVVVDKSVCVLGVGNKVTTVSSVLLILLIRVSIFVETLA